MRATDPGIGWMMSRCPTRYFNKKPGESRA